MDNESSISKSPGLVWSPGVLWVLRLGIYLIGLSAFSYILADPDLWGHVKFGELTFNNGWVVADDPYSYTAQGHRWINHEWLTEVIFYLAFALWDSTGLLILKGAIGVWIVHMLSSMYFARHSNPIPYAVCFFLGVQVMGPGFMPRPHIMTFLFLTWFIFTLYRYFEGKEKALRWTPLIFLLWTNCHGGVVAGLGIFGTVVFIECTRAIYKRETHWPRLMGWFLASCVAILINPYGIDLWVFFFHSLSMPRDISEWKPVMLFDLSHVSFKLMALLFAISLLLPVKKRVWEMAIIAVALVFGFRHQRHTVLAAILLMPYLSLQFAHWLDQFKRPRFLDSIHADFKSVLWAMAGVALLAQSYNILDEYRRNDFDIWVEPTAYPSYLNQFMETNHIDGNLLVPFDWGEYFIFNRPKSKVSVDGRFRTSYPERILKLNQDFTQAQPSGLDLIREFPTRFVITRAHTPVHAAMEHLPGWVKIYNDPVSKLFVHSSDPFARRFRNKQLVIPDQWVPYSFPG